MAKSIKEIMKEKHIGFSIIDKDWKSMPWDKDGVRRYVFKCRFRNYKNGCSFQFDFGQSIANGSKEPTAEQCLEGLQRYPYALQSFYDFCKDYGYDETEKDSRKIYKAACREYDGLERVFGYCGLKDVNDHIKNKYNLISADNC